MGRKFAKEGSWEEGALAQCRSKFWWRIYIKNIFIIVQEKSYAGPGSENSFDEYAKYIILHING